MSRHPVVNYSGELKELKAPDVLHFPAATSDPVGAEGDSYWNSASQKLRVFRAGSWGDA